MHFDIAQICISGHVINDRARTFPHSNKKYCDLCGKATIITCPRCEKPIRGSANVSVWAADVMQSYQKPLYCCYCGQAFPWTETALQASQEAVELMDELDSLEKERFKENIKR